MNYRLATEADFDALAALRWDFHIEDGEATVSRDEFNAACLAFLRWGMADGNWHYWLAEDGAEIVGHIFVHIIRTVPRPDKLMRHYGYVTNVYVRPAWRNRGHPDVLLVRPISGEPCVPRPIYRNGVGGELLAQVQKWATQQELELLFLWPSERSVTFYQRAGFTPSEDLLEFFINGRD